MNWLKEHKIFTIILSIFFALIIIVVVSYDNIGNSTVLGRSIEKVVTLVQGPVSNAGNGVKAGVKGIFQFRSIVKENEELKGQISDLNREIIQIKLTEAELAELRNLSNILGYENVTPNYSYVTADVVAMDGSNWFNLFTINAGTDDGIYKDAVVINGDGLIGRVLEV
ncbi:MAG TPA: rod shape-determining protein MreC, partial [Anaerovoracaceae bacterium]|nr:rod shape-determining protein MreC [Anaerovoracaceae bacterium]